MEQIGASARDNRLSFDLPCTKKSLGRAREKIGRFARDHGFEPYIEDIALATQEAVKNVIQHACPADNMVKIVFVAKQDRMVIEVTDTGTGFDVGVVENGSVSPMALHGRGIQIIRGLMDEVTITSDQEGTHVHMEKMRDSSSGP